jgi:hypothetical protein
LIANLPRVLWTSLLILLTAPFVSAADDAEKSVAPFGIEERVPLTTSQVAGTPAPPAPFRVKRVYP